MKARREVAGPPCNNPRFFLPPPANYLTREGEKSAPKNPIFCSGWEKPGGREGAAYDRSPGLAKNARRAQPGRAAPRPGRLDGTGGSWRLDACGPGAAGPAPPRRFGNPGRPPSHPGNGGGRAGGHHPGPPTALPMLGLPLAGAGRIPATAFAARPHPRGSYLFSSFPLGDGQPVRLAGGWT